MTDPIPGFALGKLPPRADARTLRLERYLRPALLPKPPATLHLERKVPTWPIYGNDRYGCCVTGDAIVESPGVERGYRIPYSGPVVTLHFESGKRLTVTPNHAVLTPRGFALARLIQEGDYAVGGGFMQSGDRTGDLNFDEAPARIEEKVAALERLGVTRTMAQPVDFHGDARFFNGDVDVVTPHSLLEDQADSSLGEPHGEQQIEAARQLQSALHRERSPFKREEVRRFPALRRVGRRDDGLALVGGHSRIVNRQALGLRPHVHTRSSQETYELVVADAELFGEPESRLPILVASNGISEPELQGSVFLTSPDYLALGGRPFGHASRLHPSAEGHRTDPQLLGELSSRFPGLVSLECVVKVEHHLFTGHVFDLSTSPRWYVANGILVHNCVFADVGHQIEAWTANVGREVSVTDADVLGAYSAVTGFKPSDPSTDRGTVWLDALNYWRRTGIGGHRIAGYASVRPSDPVVVRSATWLFGGLQLGIALPLSALDQIQAHQSWVCTSGSRSAPGGWGGHAVPALAYDSAGVIVVTWGRLQRLSWCFFGRYVDEAYVALAPDWVDQATKRSPTGFDWSALQADLNQFGR